MDIVKAVNGRLAASMEASAEDAPTTAWLAVSPEDLLKHFTRAIFVLKTPSPDGSSHYQSGWDDGLEAAMDAVREAVPVVFKSWDGEL